MSAQQAAQTSHEVVSKLPARLRNFFAKYPPQIYSQLVSPVRPTLENKPTTTTEGENSTPTESNLPSPYTPSRDAKGAKPADPTAWSPSRAFLYSNPEHPNPFLPRKGPNSRWWGPRYGLRQQADLVKLAKKYGVEELLPPSRKSTTYKELRRAERGLAIKGTGIGQKVKGHKWERTLGSRLEERKKAMLEMPELIREWKEVRTFIVLSTFFCCINDADAVVERSWSGLEEVAQAVMESLFHRCGFHASVTRLCFTIANLHSDGIEARLHVLLCVYTNNDSTVLRRLFPFPFPARQRAQS